jgi:PAS domain S-box-containing protein
MKEKNNLSPLEIENNKLRDEISRLRQYVSLPGFEKRTIIEIHKQFASHSLSPIILTDEQENIVHVNPAFCKMLDYTPEEVLGKNLRQFTNRVEFSTYQVNTYLRKKGIAGLFQSVLLKKDNTEIQVQISASPVLTEDGKLICIMGIVTDLTPFIQVGLKISHSTNNL